ncbi:MAG: complex I NDUFA9 subunit family protein [Hyphomicrobiales bacterium]
MSDGKLITVIGGSGFVGRYLIQSLARRGWRIRVAVRRPDLAGFLQPLGFPGQISPVQANIRYPETIRAAVESANAVVNLVGVLYNAGSQDFQGLHAWGAELAASVSRDAGCSRFVQVSAIGADSASASEYARTKAAGERAVAENFPGASVVRPSVVFGPEDNFFNQFASLSQTLPVLPAFGGGSTRLQPVYVGDVAEGICRILEREETRGRTYEFGGPEVVTLRQIFELTMKWAGTSRPIISIPWSVAKMQASVMQLLPKPMLTVDQLELLKRDNVVSEAAKRDHRTLSGLGIEPTGMEAIVPAYLHRYRKAGQFAASA